MTRRSKILIAAIILLLIVGISWFFLYPKLTADREGDSTQDPRSAFPSESEGVGSGEQGRADIQSEGELNIEDIDTSSPTPQLRKITANPTVSAIILQRDEEMVVRYVARETGHVLEAFTTTTLIKRIANTTIPRIQEALFSTDGESIVLRYLADDRETIETFLGKIEREDTAPEDEGSLLGIFLPQNISAFDINDSGISLFYVVPTESGSEGIQTNLDGEKASRIFSHPLKEWQARYASNNNLHLTTNPSATTPGFLYSVSKSGSFTRLLGNINGLVAHVHPNGDKILYSESASNSITLNTIDIETGAQTILPLKTLAEKCVWNTQEKNIIYCAAPQTIPPGDYPDIWYQGRVSFSDTLWEIDIEAKTIDILIRPEEAAGESIDVVELIISPDGSLLVFVNKKDSSLWSLTLPQEEEVDEEEE